MTSLIDIGGDVRDISSLVIPQTKDFRSAWKYDNQAIVIDVDLAKPIAKDKINVYRNNKKHAPFIVDGLGEFSADEQSKGNIDGAVLSASLTLSPAYTGPAFSVEWSLHDDTAIILDASQMIQVGMTLIAHINTQYIIARTRRKAVEDATTFAEIEAVLAELV